MLLARPLAAALIALAAAPGLRAETGYDLWLRDAPVADAGARRAYQRAATAIVAAERGPTIQIAASELERGLSKLLGKGVPRRDAVTESGAVVIGTPAGSPAVKGLGWGEDLAPLGPEGYVIRSARVGGREATVIVSSGETSVL